MNGIETHDGGETVEVSREDLEALKTSMQLAEKQLNSDDQNIWVCGHARVTDAICRISSMLEEADDDE